MVRPTILDTFNKKEIIGISIGLGHCLAWDSEGQIYSWGDAMNGKLAHPLDKATNDFN